MTFSNRSYLAIFLLVIFGLPIVSTAQTQRAEQQIDSLMKQYSAVGLSVAVVKHNKIIYTHSFGFSNKEQSVPLQDNNLFRIASISKSFLATSMMQLVEAKKVSLDDEFGKLVGFPVRNPNYPDQPITLRMVLSHTSSVHDSLGYFDLDVINPAKNPNWAGCYMHYAPGTHYEYCNLNFNMAGAALERITGQRYDQYVVKHILQPLKLYGGYCVDSLDKSRFATLYEYDSAQSFTPAAAAYNPRSEEIKNYVLGNSTPILSPTGGMKITATDLATYMCMHMNWGKYHGVRLISKASSKEMQSLVAPQAKYGLALLQTDNIIPGKTLHGHTGSAYGLYSFMFFSPDDKFGFVLITNGCKPVYSNGFNEFLTRSAQVLYNNLIQ
jgi:CubicO group peptidase (beta-lactamase class C family)